MALSAAMFPPDHPYHWLTIGSADDLRAASLDDVREFFQTYYHPANASLSLAGDIETEQAFELAEQYFGGLPAGPRSIACASRRALAASAPGARGSRRAAAALSSAGIRRRCSRADDAELDIVGRRAGARQDVAALQVARLRAAHRDRRVGLSALARDGRRVPDRLHRRGRRRADRAEHRDPRRGRGARRRTGPTADELERGLAQTEAQFIYRLQTIGGFGGKADQLNAYNVFAGDPGYFDRDRAALFRRDQPAAPPPR